MYRCLGPVLTAGPTHPSRLHRGSGWAQLGCHHWQGRYTRRRCARVRAALFDPPPFSPDKLRVEYLPGAEDRHVFVRRYTLTHNDLTGTLQLSIGRDYNRTQLSGWYTRAVRDEVLAEWVVHGRGSPAGSGAARLHVYCHVSGEESWPAPPSLRSFIFQREMTLVLDTITYAEAALLEAQPHLRDAPIRLHLRSHLPQLDRVLDWGVLGDRTSWPRASSTLLQALLGPATQHPPAAAPGDGGAAAAAAADWSTLPSSAGWRPPSEQQQEQEQQQARRQQPPEPGDAPAASVRAQQQEQQQQQQQGQQQEMAGDAASSRQAPARQPVAGVAAAGIPAGGRGRRKGRPGSGKQQGGVYNGVALPPKQLLQPVQGARAVVVPAAAGAAGAQQPAADVEQQQLLLPDGAWQAVEAGSGYSGARLPAGGEVVVLVEAPSQRRR